MTPAGGSSPDVTSGGPDLDVGPDLVGVGIKAGSSWGEASGLLSRTVSSSAESAWSYSQFSDPDAHSKPSLITTALVTITGLGILAGCGGSPESGGPWWREVNGQEMGSFAHCLPLGSNGREYLGYAMSLPLHSGVQISEIEVIATDSGNVDWDVWAVSEALPDYLPTNGMVAVEGGLDPSHLDEVEGLNETRELNPTPIDVDLSLEERLDQALMIMVRFTNPENPGTDGSITVKGYEYTSGGDRYRFDLEHHVFVTAAEPYENEDLDCGPEHRAFRDAADDEGSGFDHRGNRMHP